MTVVGLLKLILYKDPSTRSNIFAQNISAERSYRLLLCLNFQVKAKRFSKQRDVLATREPWREID